MIKEKPSRSIAKVISWRITATLITMVISYFVIGNISAALSIGFFELIAKLFVNYVHERIWIRVPFGLVTEKTDYSI